MSYLSLGVLGFIAGLSGAMLPGPMSVYAIFIALKGKLTNVFLMVLGHIFIEAVTIALLLLGLKHIMGSKTLLNAITLLGAGVLIFMGLRILVSTNRRKLPINTDVNLSSGIIVSGIFLTAFNPTFPTWWVSVGSALLARSLLFGFIGVIALVLGHWLADLTWFFLLGFAVGRGRAWLNEARYHLMLKVVSLALFGFGLWFITQVK